MPNRLAFETSPYLQQHAENPVDWYPWGHDALAESKRTGKPILLSVGYSACHWCHVMAHESFEDEEIARVMNELFVNIKVDREERPDIDQIYQVAQAMLTQRNGGWPLTMFLTPDQVPFFGGTYFPSTSRYGLPGFGDLLRRVRKFYDESAEDIDAQNAQLIAMLGRTQPSGRADPSRFSREPIEKAAQELEAMFDGEHGGFGGAPKFPHPDSIELLLRHHAARGRGTSRSPETLAENSRVMAEFTLTRMAEGGIYDQVGGGFARYSVDDEWAIPHFEKMLYDNGWLLRLYAEAWTATRNPLFARICEETAAWTMREMQSPEGGYFSSLDADSEGEEGKFYVWTHDQIRLLLTSEEYEIASAVWGLDRPANFENRHWHLVLARSVAEIARGLDMNDGAAQMLLDSARTKLRESRAKRVWPGRDEKILTSWNALMIGGMARASRAFGKKEWLSSARSALDFIRRTLWKDGKLLATYKDGHAHLDAYLDDHAFLLAALLEMLQAEFRVEDLDWATELGELLLEGFHDREAGGFFFTSHGHEKLIHRPKPGPDNATPSGNGVAAWALNRLSFLTGEARFAQPAAGTVGLFWPQIERHPSGFASLLAALEEQLEPPRTIIVAGAAEGLAPWRELLDPAFAPTTMVLYIPAGMQGLPPVLAKPAMAEVNAWVCEGMTCLPPVGSPAVLRRALELQRMPPSSPTDSFSGSNP